MGDVGRWWPRLSVAAVLAVLSVAAIAGLSRPPSVALAARTTTVAVPPAPPAVAPPAPGAILAPVAASRTVASRGDVAYGLLGGALTVSDIPTRALSAYQRAATVIDAADAECHLDWQLLAALGKVLTDHGRINGSVLDDEGVPRPRVVGQRLNGRDGTERVADTDGGTLDGDKRVDRPVGPMLMLPAVWSVVSVDGDSDGRRNPQDIDDAALGAAVFLCAGPGDLRDGAHLRDEIRRFHPGSDYTRSVLAVRAAYLVHLLPAPETVLVRELGVSTVSPVSPAVVEAAVPAPGDPSYAGNSTFVPGPSVTASPTGAPTTPAAPASTVPAAPATTSAAPSPSQSAGGGPTEEPSEAGTASDSPSDEPSPTDSPSDCPTPSDGPADDPSPTATPTDCPTSTPDATEPTPDATEPTPDATEPTPANLPATADDASPTAALAVPGVTLVPVAGWLWWRRRRPADGEARSLV